MVDKTLLCPSPPCTPGTYSGINYVLLGFIAQSLGKHAHWTDWDQLVRCGANCCALLDFAVRSIMVLHEQQDVIKGDRKNLYKEIVFAHTGTCKTNPAIAHQYTTYTDHTTGPIIFDLINYSCLNGWSMGNAAASGKNLAMFFRDVFGPSVNGTRKPLVTPETARAMQEFHRMPSLGPGYYYGLGLFVDNGFMDLARGDRNATYMFGHGAYK